MEIDISRIVKILMQRHKLDVSRFAPAFLEKTVKKRLEEYAFNTEEAYYVHLENEQQEATVLYAALGISYSEFFRHSLTFGVLEHLIIPALIRSKVNSRRNEIRVWSAACASGQEAYSIAMLLEEFRHVPDTDFTYRIFASDISHEQIEAAQKGVYSKSSLQNISLGRLSKWFTQSGSDFIVSRQLKKNIEFSVFDVFNASLQCPPSSIFGEFDLVVCANMMFYYSSDNHNIIIQKLEKCLTPRGLIVTGETERDTMFMHGYDEVYQRSAIFRKM